MLKVFQRYAPVLLVLLIFSSVLYPASSPAFSIAVLTISIGIAIIYTIHRNWEIHQQALEPEKSNGAARKQFIRNTILDLLGLALTMGVAIWLGRWAGGYAGQAVGITSTALSARVAGILAAMLAGFAGALIVGRVWGRASEPLRAGN